jgi:hypothetical protein
VIGRGLAIRVNRGQEVKPRSNLEILSQALIAKPRYYQWGGPKASAFHKFDLRAFCFEMRFSSHKQTSYNRNHG